MNSTDDPKVQALIRQIEEAFADRLYPGDSLLIEGETAAAETEENRLAAAFRGKHWKELSPELLRRNSDALALFRMGAFRFYLPAFLIACIKDLEEADIIPEMILGMMTPPRVKKAESRWRMELFEARMNGLSCEERSAIKAWLQYMIRQDWSFASRSELKRLVPYWKLELD